MFQRGQVLLRVLWETPRLRATRNMSIRVAPLRTAAFSSERIGMTMYHVLAQLQPV